MELFRLFGKVMLEGGDETEKQLDSIDKKGGGLGQTLGKIGKGAAVAAGAMAGVGAAVFGMASKASATADNIDKLSQKIGISRQAYQEWDFILSQSGASVDGLQMGVKTLSKAAYEASQGVATYADSFDALGVQVTDSNGKMKDQETLLLETIAALSAMDDETKRTALASELLGRSATEMAPMLNAGAGAVEDMRSKAHDLGLVLGDEAIDSGVNFTDTMDQVKRTLGALFTSALAPLLPVINDLAQQFIQILPPLMEFIQPLISKLIPVIQRLIEALLPVFIKLLDAFMPVLDPLIDLFLMLVDTALIPMIDLLVPLIEAIIPIFVQLLEALIPVLQPLLELFAQLLQHLMPIMIDVLTWITDNVLPVFTNALGEIAPVLQNLSDKFQTIFANMKSAFKGVVNFIIRGINALIRGLNKIHFSIPDWVPLVGGKSFGINIGQIPQLADGGELTKSGRVIVGDAGPEVLDLPKGARVSPLQSVDKKPTTIIMNINGRQFARAVVQDLTDIIQLSTR